VDAALLGRADFADHR